MAMLDKVGEIHFDSLADSNASIGKSTLLNMVLGVKEAARTVSSF